MPQVSFVGTATFTLQCAATVILFWSSLDIAECKGGAEQTKVLHRILLDDYDPAIRPNRNYGTPTDVSIQLHVATVLGLDTKYQLLHLRAFLRLMWTDESLQWNPEEHGGIHHITVLQNSIWKPDVLLFNAANERDKLGHAGVYISVSFNGVVKWEPAFNLASSCKLDMSNYPFDVSVCPVIIASWMMDNRTITFTLPDIPVNLDNMVINGEYDISFAEGMKVAEKYEDEFFEKVHFHIRLERRPGYIIISLLLPATMLSVLGATSFLLGPNEPEKISVSITVMVSFIVFLDFMDNNMPHTSDNICLLVVYISALLTLAFLSAVGNVFITAIRRSDNGDQKENLGAMDQNSGRQDRPSRTVVPPNGSSSSESRNAPSLWETDNDDSFSVHGIMSAVASGGQGRSCWMNTARAWKLNKAFLIIYCSTFVLILCLMTIMICV